MGKYAYQIFKESVKKDMYIESFFKAPNLLTDSLTEETSTVASRETEFQFRKISDQFLARGHFGPSGFRCREPIGLFSNPIIFNCRIISVKTLMDAMQPLVLDKKKFDSLEKFFLLLTFSVPKASAVRKISRNNFTDCCSTIAKWLGKIFV